MDELVQLVDVDRVSRMVCLDQIVEELLLDVDLVILVLARS